MTRSRLSVVQLEDRITPAIDLITANVGGTAAASPGFSSGFDRVPEVSNDGRYFVFASQATDLVSPAPDGFQHLYWRDSQTGETQELPDSKSSPFASLSADGRYVAYATGTDYTGPGGSGGVAVYDTTTHTMAFASDQAGGGGNRVSAIISPDGTYVAYESQLVQPGVTTQYFAPPSLFYQVYLYNRVTDTRVMVSTTADGLHESNGGLSVGQFDALQFSGDSKTLFYGQNATDIVTGVTYPPNQSQLFSYDIASAKNSLLTIAESGTSASDPMGTLRIRNSSSDGRYVVFESGATDLDTSAPGSSGGSNVFVRDRVAGTTTMISTTPDRTFSGGSNGNISADGHYVMFQALGLLPNSPNALTVYRYNVSTGTLEPIAVRPNGSIAFGAISGNQSITAQSMSADGRYVAFTSDDPNLGATPLTSISGYQLWVRDTVTGVNSLITFANGSTTAASNGGYGGPRMLPDGSMVAFNSQASDLTPLSDTNNSPDVFIADVPVPPPPPPVPGARITNAVFSGTGNTFNAVVVTFSEAIDPMSFTVGDVVMSGPNGVISATSVAPVTGSTTEFIVSFQTQSTFGTYSVTVGPNVLDLAGNSMDQNQNGTNGETPGDQFTTTDALAPIPPFFAVGAVDGSVRIVNSDTGTTITTFRPLDVTSTQYKGLVEVALGDFNGDGTPDVVVSAADPFQLDILVANKGGKVFVYDGTSLATGKVPSTPFKSFTPFATTDGPAGTSGAYTNGLNIATGDVDGDGTIDLIAGTRGATGGFGRAEYGRLAVIDGASPPGSNTVIGGIQKPFGPGYQKGVVVAAGNADGVAGDEIAVTRGGPVNSKDPNIQKIKLKVLQLQSGSLRELHLNADGSTSFAPFGALSGPANAIKRDGRVAFLDADGDGKDELVFTALDPLSNASNEQVRVAVYSINPAASAGAATIRSTGSDAGTYLTGTAVVDHAITHVHTTGAAENLALLTESAASGFAYLDPLSGTPQSGGFALSIVHGGITTDGV